jgi:molybdopterin synthase catalytic subunit
MNKIRLLFFATLRERAGVKSMDLEIPENMTVRELKEKLALEQPALKDSLKSVLITVNREYAFDEAVIPPNAEMALFPPVSGG